MAALFLFLAIGSGLARAEDDRRQGLYLAAGDSAVPAPVLGSTVEVRVTGIIARAKVTQIFKNPSKEWVEGIYIFPLPEDAAVDTLRLKIGDRTVQGVIQEKGEARQTYEAAKQQGMKASLLEQQRPDVFTTSVANIGPGETVEVAIELQQTVRYQHGKFGLRFPMVVAPRPEKKGRLSRHLLPPVLRRGSAPINPFAFHADLNPGFPLASVESPTHPIVVEKGKSLRYAVDLKNGVAPADGDLALEWKPAVGREPRAVYYSEEVDGERYALLMVMPPDAPEAAASRLPRETILIIDTSGSMSGASIQQAREALLFALGKLRPTDWFNVIRFSSTASAVFPESVPASPEALDKARRFIADLNAEGGTEMLPALQIAFRKPAPAGLVPQVIFATDGEIYDEARVVQFITSDLGSRRLFPVAIGSAPKVPLLRRLAALGSGSFTQIADAGKVAPAMTALFSQLEAPMLQRIEVQWSDPSAEAWPERVPDLYLGEPLVVTARLHDSRGPVVVAGVRGGNVWEDSFPVAADVPGAGIDKLWARSKIQALTDSLQEGGDPEEVRRAVADLGLRHHLITDYTSLVAVDEQASAPPGVQPVTRVVPVNAPRDSVTLSASVVEDVITVSAESPLVDERRMSTGATVSQAELENIPTARVPGEALQTPGVLTDRINVGGNESGQPSQYAGPGSGGDQAVLLLDNMVITDMVPMGFSPPEDEAKGLCAAIQRNGWNELTLERALAAAPSLAEDLRKADAAGLLRGFVALALEGKGCSEPPAEVLAEARQYVDRFGIFKPH
jgi:Ca-activated chloride channel family protein